VTAIIGALNLAIYILKGRRRSYIDKNKKNYKSAAREGVLCFLIPYEL
jgi:hypothetical protein